MDSPLQPLWLVGDCHVDGLHGVLVRDEQQNPRIWNEVSHLRNERLRRSGWIRPNQSKDRNGTRRLSTFRPNSDAWDEPIIDESLVGPNIFAGSFRPNKYVINDPVLFSVGDFDARRILGGIPSEADFALTFEPKLLANIPTFRATALIAGKQFQEVVLEVLRPLFVGLRHLRNISFCNIALHSISPPTVDDQVYKTLGASRTH